MPLKLHGLFTSHPLGPKPRRYAPRTQVHIHLPPVMQRTERHDITPYQPPAAPVRKDITPYQAPQPTPRKDISPPQPMQRSPRQPISPYQPPALSPRRSLASVAHDLSLLVNKPKDGDPYGTFRFALVVDVASASGSSAASSLTSAAAAVGAKASHTVATVLECSGLKSSSQPFPINEGGYNGHVELRPGQNKWENLVIKFATSLDTDLLAWRNAFIMDNYAGMKRSGAISLMNLAGEELRRFEFTDAWPVSWEGPSFSSEGSGIAIETVELAHAGITVKEGAAAQSALAALAGALFGAEAGEAVGSALASAAPALAIADTAASALSDPGGPVATGVLKDGVNSAANGAAQGVFKGI